MKKLLIVVLAFLFLSGTAGATGRITDLAALAEAPAVGDLVEIIDVSDTSMAATGTNKGITIANLFAGLAALEGAQTFTGAKTFGTDVKVLFRAAEQYVNSPAANVIEVAGGTTLRLRADDEDLQITKTGTNGITVGTSTGVTDISFGAVNLATTGTVRGGANIINTTANPYALSAADAYGSAIFYGATGEIDLPAGASGMVVMVYNIGAFTITIDPNASEVIVRDGTTQTGGVSMTLSSGAGNYVGFIHNGTNWYTAGFKGTLAAGS